MARPESPGPWRWQGRPRVLIENPDDGGGLAEAAILRRAGYSVAVCPGPLPRGRPAAGCPLLVDEPCALANGADAIVTSLGLDRPRTRDVVRALRRLYPETPLIIEVRSGEERWNSDVVEGCLLVESPDELPAAVGAALA